MVFPPQRNVDIEGIDLFNRNFVHAGVFSKEIGAIAGQLETMRNIGVYDR